MNRLINPFFALVVGAITVMSFVAPDLPMFQRPELARIFFWHFPCPILATFLLVGGAYMSLQYLRTNDLKWDIRALAMQELAYVFCLLTMATGILFSKAQWGAWWQNDPRQTSFLLVLMLYFAYFAYRASTNDAIRRASNSAGLCLAAFIPAMFLIYVFPRLDAIQSFHPTDSVMKGKIVGWYAYVTLAIFALVTTMTVVMYRMRVSTAELLRKLEDSNGSMENHGGDPTPTGVVRPISVPSED